MLILQCVLVLILIPLIKSTEVANITSGRIIDAPLLTRIVNKVADCKSCTCGLSNKNRIVGGTNSDVNKYPWVAMLFSRGRFTCGASLINSRYVLTAAHCAGSSQASSYEAHFLQNRLDTTTTGTIIRKIHQVGYTATLVQGEVAHFSKIVGAYRI